MNKRFLALVCSFAFLSALTHAQTSQPPADPTERPEAFAVVDAYLDSVQAYHHIPALSAGIVLGDNLAWSKGYGTIDLQHTVPASPQTIYSICSISKLFTSIALMQQVEAGKVQLDAPLTTYLPWATFKPPTGNTGPITLRGLLTHSAGLPRESDSATGPAPTSPSHRSPVQNRASQPDRSLPRRALLPIQQPRPHASR